MAPLSDEEPMVFSPVNASEDTGVPQSDVEVLAAADRDVNTNSPDSQDSQVSQASSNNSSHHPVPTTSRKATKKTGKPRIGKGKMVRVKRKELYHLLSETQRASLPPLGPTVSGDYPCIGKVVGGSSNGGWVIEFDDLPESPDKQVTVKRNRVALLEQGEYEVPLLQKDDDNYEYKDCDDDNADHDDECGHNDQNAKKKRKKLSPHEDSIRRFCLLDDSKIKSATKFVYQWGREGCNNQVVEWKIYGETEYITQLPLQIPNTAPTMISDNIDFRASPITNFFEHVFPDVTGHGKTLDAYLANPRATHHSTYLKLGHTFHDEKAVDPDWLVKQCYTLMIAAVTEVEQGVENLWKRGDCCGRRHSYPDFGKYVDINTFKCFESAAPFCWADSTYWYRDRLETPWDVFLPCLKSFNDRRHHLLNSVVFLLLDESMSGWRPKTSKLGGLPNYTFEPRKPIPLGTMFRNGAECITGILAFQDPVQLPEQQAKKKFHGEPLSLPDGSKIGAHTAEVLRQVEGAGVQRGGWVGGDAWFGSIMSSVEVLKQLRVHSTWVIKNNHHFYPKQCLQRVLRARHGNRIAGKWVVFSTTIAEVPLIAVAYTWSQNNIAFIISTCGTTCPAEGMYKSSFEDEFGHCTYKELPRPCLVDFLFEYLPLVDEHNRQRQSILGLEKCWPTKSCWFRLVTTVVGMCVVDLHRLYRNHNQGLYGEIEVQEFADMLCTDLVHRSTSSIAHHHLNAMPGGPIQLKRIVHSGIATREATVHQKVKYGRATGQSFSATCWMCRKYHSKYKTTTWCCVDCDTPLCSVDRSGPERMFSCVYEHMNSADARIRCEPGRKKGMFPTALKFK
jgi:hypothetical protein